MNLIDLFALREQFTRGRILLCFNGPISRSLIEEIGNALKNYLHADCVQPSAAMDVFSIYVELTQNIRHYSLRRGYDDAEGSATVVVARDDHGRYIVIAGNVVERADGAALLERVNMLAAMDKTALKAAYKTQLRKPREADSASGAGLGLIDVARKAAQPLSATLADAGPSRAFFSLRAVV